VVDDDGIVHTAREEKAKPKPERPAPLQSSIPELHWYIITFFQCSVCKTRTVMLLLCVDAKIRSFTVLSASQKLSNGRFHKLTWTDRQSLSLVVSTMRPTTVTRLIALQMDVLDRKTFLVVDQFIFSV
jgi:hypothetical protein